MTDATLARQRAEPTDWLALGAALLTVVLWASAFVGIRAVADDLSPGSFALGSSWSAMRLASTSGSR